jgi:hypothetical protein
MKYLQIDLMALNEFVRRLIELEVRLDFLYIPAHGIEMMSSERTKIKVNINGKMEKLTYKRAPLTFH